MTLKEKFKEEKIYINPYSLKLTTESAETFEQIVDEFAIEFAEWCIYYRDKNRNVYGDMLHAKSKYDDTYTTKQLLEIYKKEKGL